MKAEKPAYYQNLIEFIANPADQRTWQQFSIDNGIDYNSVWCYRTNHSQEIETDVNRARPRFINQIQNVALKALFKRIDKSDLALKMALTMCGLLVERSEVKAEYLTPDDKKEKVKEMLAAYLNKKEPPATQ